MLTKVVLLLIGVAFISSLQFYIRSFHPSDLISGFYFQECTSDRMMQTLPIKQLYDDPLENLFYLHIQPPMLDIIRAFLAALSPLGESVALLRFVDTGLYVIWDILYSILTVLVFAWIRSATGSFIAAAVASILWLLHPGALAMAVFLEGTMLSAVLTTWLLYEMWRFSEKQGSELRIAVAGILLFLTRTVFQWFFIPVLVVALWIGGASRKSICRIMIPICLLVAVFLFKQFALFRTLSTTTFAGEHKLGLIQYRPTGDDITKVLNNLSYRYPEAARKHTVKYNSEKQAIKNIVFGSIFSNRLDCCFKESMKGVGKSLCLNASRICEPTSRYGHPPPFLDRLFWREPYDYVFSRPFLIPLSLAIAFWIWRNRDRMRATYHRLAAPILAVYTLMILLIANQYDYTEVDRLKFFLEPSLYVFVVCQFVLALRWIRGGVASEAPLPAHHPVTEKHPSKRRTKGSTQHEK